MPRSRPSFGAGWDHGLQRPKPARRFTSSAAISPYSAWRCDDPTVAWRASLQRAFAAVPIPAGAKPASGSDAHMTVWQPATDRLWEFFHMRLESDGWHAAWGGAIDDVSASPGYYTTSSWPGALPQWGATATSLPVAGGLMTLRELRAGVINHALAIALPAPRAGVFALPAERSDGTGGPNTIPGGCTASAGSAARPQPPLATSPHPHDRHRSAAIRDDRARPDACGDQPLRGGPDAVRRGSAVLRPARHLWRRDTPAAASKLPLEPPPGHEASCIPRHAFLTGG